MYFILLVTFASVLAKAQTVIPSYVPTNSLVGWWPFNGNANDLSVNANNGTVNGATLTADRFGNANKAYGFNGNTSYISSNANFSSGSQQKSFSLWAKFSSINDRGWLISNNTCINASQNNCFGMFQENTNNSFFFYGMSGGDVSFNHNINTNSYSHFAITYKNDSVKIYINSILISTTNKILNTIGNNGVLFGKRFLGTLTGSCGNDNNSNGLYSGALDDIGIWNRALTECEIKKLYHSPSFTAAASTASICAGQNLTLTAGGVTNYSWSNGANTASTIVTPSTSTIYTVTSTYTTGCSDTKTVSVNVSACTGFNEVSFENNFTVFPNPAKELITITAGQALIGKTYTINDYTGKVIATGKISSEKTTISMHGLAKGIYFFATDGKSHKIIKE